MRIAWPAALAVIWSNNPVAAQSEAVQLAPSSDWVLEYADDSCALLRKFGAEGQSVQMEMRQFSPGEEFQLTVSSANFERRERDPEFAFLPDTEEVSLEGALTVEFADGSEGFMVRHSTKPPSLIRAESELLNFERPRLDPAARDAREGQMTGISIRRAFNREFVLQTGNMHPAMNAMRACLDELLTHWGIDADAHRNLQREAVPINFSEMAREVSARYPRSMLSRGRQAILRIRMDVSAEGRATGCHHQISYNDDPFEEISCALLLEHARFSPALDVAGNPINSYYVLSVIYVMG